ncbi:MAG: hypothetical protein ACYDDB_03095 [bacterium]
MALTNAVLNIANAGMTLQIFNFNPLGIQYLLYVKAILIVSNGV